MVAMPFSFLFARRLLTKPTTNDTKKRDLAVKAKDGSIDIYAKRKELGGYKAVKVTAT